MNFKLIGAGNLSGCFDLDVTSGTSGKISADLTLTPVQADHLRRGRVYLQLHSEEAPNGNLRGWLLP